MSVADAATVDRARAGDGEAFAAIFRHYRPRIHAFCYGLLGNADDADDLTQETFLKAYCALGRTAEQLALGAWLYRIAANACTDVLRRRQYRRALPWEDFHHDQPSGRRDDDPLATLLDNEAQRTFDAICGAMAPRNRRVLALRAHDDCSLQQIGAQLGLTNPAVKSLLFRARNEYRGLVEAGNER